MKWWWRKPVVFSASAHAVFRGGCEACEAFDAAIDSRYGDPKPCPIHPMGLR